ncbi:MAG: hypothetical protein QG567_451 [Campylobacterota bacterium]|nr:hypothetical protein [Campylobacterota bacterium]
MRLLNKVAKSAVFLFLTTGALFGAEYDVDRSHSSVGFKVKHMMVSNVNGVFKEFSGAIDYDQKTKKLKSINGEVIAKSVDTGIEKRDEHLRNEDFFDATKFPKMNLKSIEIKGDKIVAELTIKNITKKVNFEYEFGGEVTDPWGNNRIGLELEGKINRKDFGLTYNKTLETGGLLVGDEVKIHIELEAIEK